MKLKPYDRNAAVKYAKTWAKSRNPVYYDFESTGGDCTNFVSQCLFAGAKIMNFTPQTGWYYRSLSDRAPAWSSVFYLRNFLTKNVGVGPHAIVAEMKDVLPGDIVQFCEGNGRCYHSALITQVSPVILVAAHTYDAIDKSLSDYEYEAVKFLHIERVYGW